MRHARLAMVAGLVALLHCALSAAAPPATVPVRAIQVAPHSWYVEGMRGVPSKQNQGHTSNAGFVVTPAGVVVFDALGTPPLGEARRAVTSMPMSASNWAGCILKFRASGRRIAPRI